MAMFIPIYIINPLTSTESHAIDLLKIPWTEFDGNSTKKIVASVLHKKAVFVIKFNIRVTWKTR
jgi:hypothetical protein